MEPSEDNDGNTPASRPPSSANGTPPAGPREKLAETIRLTMLSLLGFALFCLMIALSTSDSALLVADPLAKLPYADLPVSFKAFVFLAPVLLVFITMYLHIFYGHWLPGRESEDNPTTLFSFDERVPRVLTAIIFYWLVPFVLGVITWKAGANIHWGLFLVSFSSAVTSILVYVGGRRYWRRRYTASRLRNLGRIVLRGVMIGVMVVMALVALMPAIPLSPYFLTYAREWVAQRQGAQERTQKLAQERYRLEDKLAFPPDWPWPPRWWQILPRGLNIQRADLKGRWLAGVDLWGATADQANFEGANLRQAKLQCAILRDAQLSGAKLGLAHLQCPKPQGTGRWRTDLKLANLQGADLQLANLEGAWLERADLGCSTPGCPDPSRTNLSDANLQRADLKGAKLNGAVLERAKLQGADLRCFKPEGKTPQKPQCTDLQTAP
jgi:uncharacterized protein YjbI with pentapeptide repeats